MVISGAALLGTTLDKNKLNNTKRTFVAFEGRANAELVERALGDHDLSK